MIEREPITVVCSEMGWIRAMKGHLAPDAEIKFKDGDGPRFFLHAETTDRLLLFASNGRMFTLACAEPAGRARHGRAGAADDRPAERGAGAGALRARARAAGCCVASEAGDGFVLPEDEAVAQTRAGRQVLNLKDGRARPGLPAGARATTWRWSARTASCWSSRAPSCRRWAAARACGCRGTRTAAAGRRHDLRPRRRARVEGPGRAHPHGRRRRSSPNGSARGPAPGGWRRAASRGRTASAEVSTHRRGPTRLV